MHNDSIKKLCIALITADSEEQVISILKAAGFWDSLSAWRLYGDRDSNYSTIGNQQSRPEAALVEKIVNSVDARLMNECMRHGVDPKSEKAPETIRHAVARFFENKEITGDIGGTLQDWPQARQKEQSAYITVAVTGTRATPCVTICDQGEGQTPLRMPDTFLSIDRSNKLRIAFVQGKFNMGGTGVLKFCGQNKLQLIVSKRNPEIVHGMGDADSTSDHWGFTVIRREQPQERAGAARNSVFTYLAPVGCDSTPNKGNILAFRADSMPLMPDGNVPYSRQLPYGSCIKMYEYDMRGFKSHVLMKGGLLSRLETLLPEIALPVRVHECRDFKGHSGSFANTLVGLASRLGENRGGNLEDGYPTSAPFKVQGHEMIAEIYAFKGDKADSYRTNEGIIFTINGQTHGTIPKTFFSRTAVKMGRLAKALLVFIDCTKLSIQAREDLFMNSRDRLSGHELRKAIEEALEDLIGKHPGLKALREKRRSEEIAERLEDAKPLEDVLRDILKSSPSLERLFLLGTRLSRPYKTGSGGDTEGGGAGGDSGEGLFVGKPHPSYFQLRKTKGSEIINRSAEWGRRCRIKFETDVVNDYFSRDSYRGRYNLEIVSGALTGVELDHTLTLHNGIANWSVSVPEDDVTIGDEMTLQFSVVDDTLSEPFINYVKLHIVPQTSHERGKGELDNGSGTGTPGTGGNGSGGAGGKHGNGNKPDHSGVQLPDIVEVKEGDPSWEKHGFDDLTACKIIDDGDGDNHAQKSSFTFYINVHNRALLTDIKDGSSDAKLVQSKFVFGNVLVGLALIHDHRTRNGHWDKEIDQPETERAGIETIVDNTSRALAPFLIPMIDYLGSLTVEGGVVVAQAGDDE